MSVAPTPSADRYDRLWAEVYGDMSRIGPAHRHMRRILRGLLERLDYSSAVDVGCGAGHNVELLTAGRRLERLTGVDVSAGALERAAQDHQGEWRQLDLQEEALGGSWDLVLCSLVLEHLPHDLDALRNMRSMARRHLVVSTIGGDIQRYRPYEERVGHVRNYRAGELERKVRDAGFEVRAVVRWGFPFYSPLARKLTRRTVPAGELGAGARAIAGALFGLYFLNSSRRGDLLVLHAVADGA